MKKIALLIAVIVSTALLPACAGYSITHNGNGDGYDVYRPEPYLLINQAGSKATAEIVWLPNFTERYRIDTWNFLGKADFQFEIEGGWKLTKITDKSDNTEIASNLLDIVEKSVKSGTVALTGEISLFRLVYNERGEFIGLAKMPYVQPEGP